MTTMLTQSRAAPRSAEEKAIHMIVFRYVRAACQPGAMKALRGLGAESNTVNASSPGTPEAADNNSTDMKKPRSVRFIQLISYSRMYT